MNYYHSELDFIWYRREDMIYVLLNEQEVKILRAAIKDTMTSDQNGIAKIMEQNEIDDSSLKAIEDQMLVGRCSAVLRKLKMAE